MRLKNIGLAMLLTLSVQHTTQAAETAELATAESTPAAVGPLLPICVDRPTDVERILAGIKANAKSEHKYDAYRSQFQSETDINVMARLVYAETLAANCPDLNSQITDKIAATIASRVALRNGNVRSVLFQRDQFASSLNNYSESHYRDFLCPKDPALWAVALASANRANNGELTWPRDGVQYYLFKHSSRFKPPQWAEGNKAQPVIETNPELSSCIRFYRNSQFR